MTLHYPDLAYRVSASRITSLKFLRSFLGCHFAGKPLVTSRNISCFLRLLPHEVSEMSCHFVLTTKTTQPRQVFLVNCPVFCQLCCRIDIIFHIHCIVNFFQIKTFWSTVAGYDKVSVEFQPNGNGERC